MAGVAKVPADGIEGLLSTVYGDVQRSLDESAVEKNRDVVLRIVKTPTDAQRRSGLRAVGRPGNRAQISGVDLTRVDRKHPVPVFIGKDDLTAGVRVVDCLEHCVKTTVGGIRRVVRQLCGRPQQLTRLAEPFLRLGRDVAEVPGVDRERRVVDAVGGFAPKI